MRASFIEGGHLSHATLISLLAYVGLRPREALDLKWEMVERDRLILPAELTKGRLSRAPDIPRPVVADLGRWRLACGGLGGLVFPRPRDGRTAHAQTRRLVTKHWRGSLAQDRREPMFSECSEFVRRSGPPDGA